MASPSVCFAVSPVSVRRFSGFSHTTSSTPFRDFLAFLSLSLSVYSLDYSRIPVCTRKHKNQSAREHERVDSSSLNALLPLNVVPRS